ncbi:hypothetical protein ONZ45_g9929 [Pleurotus djamor]|nr:hypothetical protein ONZ45_g9929 [Pleurotus djamor]
MKKIKFNQPPPNSDAQILIDEEIAKFEAVVLDQDTTEAVRALKARRNSLATISRLPAELLSLIFIIKQPEFPGLFAQKFRSEVISILGVCRYWNEIAMKTPQLWTNFDLYYPFSKPYLSTWESTRSAQRMNELLNRAKSSPLSLRCLLPEYGGQALRLIDMGNVEHLWIYSRTAAPLCKFIGPRSEMPSPSPLKSLSVTLPIQGVDLSLAPSNLLWNNMPSLQSLTLTGLATLDVLPSLPFLKKFTLDPAQSMGIHSNLTLAWLVNSLANTPAIESIDVRSLYNNSGPNAIHIPSDLRVSLACLKHLRILGLDPEGLLFAHIEIPPSAIIHAYCVDHTADPPSNFSNYQHIIERFTQWNSGSTVERIVIISESGFRIDIYMPCEGDNPRPLLRLSLGIAQLPVAITESCLADLCHALPLSSTHRLSLHMRHSKPSEGVYLDPWVELLHDFVNIKRLDIYGSGHTFPILKGLFKPPYDDVLCNSTLEVVTMVDGNRHTPERTVAMKYIVQDMIRERMDAGAPLKEIRLNEGLLSDSVVRTASSPNSRWSENTRSATSRESVGW